MTPLPSLSARLSAVQPGPDARAVAAGLLKDHYEAARARIARRLGDSRKAAGVEIARQYSQAADDMLTALWAYAADVVHPARMPDEEAVSLLAVGGYGRGVLAPYSDLDLLILHDEAAGARARRISEFVHYVLWDMGLKVGSALRTPAQNLALAEDDMTVRTALLEARALAGNGNMSQALLARFQQDAAAADPRPFIAAKLEERDARHRKTGAVRYRVEPNIKDGKGGLRDLNALFWIARALAPESPLGERALAGLLTARERRLFVEAFDFLWAVRCHVHLIAGRAEERLTFDLQPETARRMGWRGRRDEPAVERFMRRYFLVARDVGVLTRAVSAQLEARHQKSALSLSREALRPLRRLDVDGFVVHEGRLSVESAQVFVDDPVKLLRLFAVADRNDLDLHPDAFSAVTRSLSLLTPRLRRDPEAAQAFLSVLVYGKRPYRSLTIMNETGLLGRFLPEWGRIVGQTQFNMYHAYTVDEHTLQAIGIINDIARGKLVEAHPLSSRIAPLIDDYEALMLAMLLHDVGKGGERGQLEDGAIAARRACERLGVEPRRIELVVWLVRNHLLLSDYAQKRDVADPETLRAFAEQVGTPERLRLLLVLTVADIRAVGPGVWNSWKGQLMRSLYEGVGAVFRGERVEEEDPLAAYPALAERARATGAAAEARAPTFGDIEQTTEVAVATADRIGLFADLASALAAAGADVTGARLATAADGMALDVFQIQDGVGAPFGQGEPRRLKALERLVERAAVGARQARPVEGGVQHPRRSAFDVQPVVMIDDTASLTATVVEVSCADRPGLLADLARTLADLGLSIRSAHVATFGERAVDSFYVTEADGSLVTGSRRQVEVQVALRDMIDRDARPGRKASSGATLATARASTRDVSELRRRARRMFAVSRRPEAR